MEFFIDHSKREKTLSSAAFFELFSSVIIFLCLISCQGICYSASLLFVAETHTVGGIALRVHVMGPNGILSFNLCEFSYRNNYF